jgi:hypothetical protein
MWYRMMTIAFLANGLGAFGVAAVGQMEFGSTHTFLYLAIWYSGGFVVATGALLAAGPSLRLREVVVGGVMGVCSSVGWFCIGSAMAHEVPAYLVLPIAIAGSLSVVAAVGVIGFKERLSFYGYAGIVAGVAAIVLLVWPPPPEEEPAVEDGNAAQIVVPDRGLESGASA